MSEEARFKLPKKLQYRFFEQAEELARKFSRYITSKQELINGLKGLVIVHHVSSSPSKSRIACVDGSILPKPTDRVGGRFNFYVVGCMIVEDGDIVYEDYESGYVITDKSLEGIVSNKLGTLIMTKLEREMALKCIKEQSPDLLLIDGSFFGWRSRCSELLEKGKIKINVDEEIDTRSLIDELFQTSKSLLEEKRCLTAGIVKRTSIQAIDGWLLLNEVVPIEKSLDVTDKYIFNELLQYKGSYFDYDVLYVGKPLKYRSRYEELREIEFKPTFLHYDMVKGFIDELIKLRKSIGSEIAKELFLYKINDRLIMQTLTNLCGKDSKAYREALEKLHVIASTKRAFVRSSTSTPPICIETSRHNDLGEVIGEVLKTVNEVTGLPFPLDLLDSNIALDRRLGAELVEEVEARLLRMGLSEVSAFLSSNNPQKSE